MVHYGIVLVGVLLICSVSAAADTRISLNADNEWLVAGSGGTSAVLVTVTNATTGLPVAGQSIVFSRDPAMGAVTPSSVTTGVDGTATAMFTAGTKSGSVTITARALNPDGTVAAENTTVRRVDHAAPYRLALGDYSSEATVGSEVPIVLAMEDRYGNRIDNLRGAESVAFSVGSPDDSAVFVGTGKDYAVCPVDETGNVTVTLRLGRKAGENIVYVDLPDPIADAYFTFYGLSNAPPASITCAVSPGGTPAPWVPADGTGTFTLTYTLKDAYGNPSANRSLLLTTSLGESLVDPPPRSNSDGKVVVSYGPKDTTGRVTITAASVDDSSVTCSQTVEFTNTAPVDMLLSASPQTMPSLDVNPSQTADIRAKVVDVKGNPVKGQVVTFSLSDTNTTGSAPSLKNTSAVTDEDGYAIVPFIPGTLPRRGEKGYTQSATGTCTVTADWTYEGASVTHAIPVTWKNYPYLSISTSVEPGTVAVNGTVNVTLTLKGDGYALQPDPIDVVLAIDRSGSMLYDNPDRMHSVREAAKQFVGNMSTRDRVAVVSFGRNGNISRPGVNSGISTSDVNNNYVCPVIYSDYATLDAGLSIDPAAIRTTLDSLVPDHGTPMRHGIYMAVGALTGRDDAVKAIIVLSDGDYNWYGDPLARGEGRTPSSPTDFGNLASSYYTYTGLSAEEQNMANYALAHHVKIYSIGYAESISPGGRSTLRTLAETTGGKYYDGDAANIEEIYRQIAGDLKTEAGVNTTMNLVMKDLEVNNATVRNTVADPVLEYCFMPGASTAIESWTDNRTGRYQVVPLHTEDQTADWENDRNLRFAIGTVRLGQTWTATYTLKVLRDGNINIFGPRSALSFNGGADSLDLPKTFITAVPDLTNTGMRGASLDLDALRHTGSEPVTDFLTVGWRLNYTGNCAATQKLFYSADRGKTWTPFLAMASRPAGERGEVASLDVRSLAAGKYLIRVHATAPDAPDDGVQLVDEVRVGSFPSNKIRLE